MINALNFLALLMILHYSLTILNINANALSLIFFINANTLVMSTDMPIFVLDLDTLFLSGAKISVKNYVGQTWIVGLLSKFFVK